MSDDQKEDALKASPTGQTGMTDRLASLRASIRASKTSIRVPEVKNSAAAKEPTDEPEGEAPPTQVSSISADNIPALRTDDADDDPYEAAETNIASNPVPNLPTLADSADESEEEPEPPEMDRGGLQFVTDDLHRVAPAVDEEPAEVEPAEPEAAEVEPAEPEAAEPEPKHVEPPVHEEPPADGIAAQMDAASDAAEVPAVTDYEAGPTRVRRIEDLVRIEGTPLYMSPEQCQNEAVTPATDVYSLGIMLFELLEGRAPYLGLSIEEVLIKHQDAPIPDQASEFTPDDIKDLVARMLAKDPADRPDTAEIIDVLQRHVTIGGADVHGLEEESWTVDHVEPGPIQVNGPPMATAEIPVAAEEQEAKKPPFVLFGVIGAIVVIVVLALTVGGGDEPAATPEPEPPSAVLVNETTAAPEEQPVAEEEPVAEEPTGQDSMEFGAEPDAGQEPAEEPAEPVEPEVVEEPPIADPEPPSVNEPPAEPPKPKTKTKTKTKKKGKIRELRLDL